MQCLDCGHDLTVEEEDGKTYVKPCEHCMKESYDQGCNFACTYGPQE